MTQPTLTRRTVHILLATGMMLSALPIFIPAAEAQTFTPSLTLEVQQQPTTSLAINGAPQQIKIRWVYTFREQTSSIPTAVTTSTTLHFDPAPVCNAAGFVITGPQAISIPIGGGQQSTRTSYDGVATFAVLATQDAPGETPTPCIFKAYVDALNSQITKTETATVSATVTAAYLGLLSVSVPTLIDEAGPQKQISYTMDITNVGNARTNVIFSIDNQDTKAQDGWQSVAPGQLLLESRAQGGTTTTKQAAFTISTPYRNGWNNDETTFVFRLTPVSTNNQDVKGAEVQVNVLARVRGIYVPGPEPMLLAGAIIGAALIARMASKDEE
jgi:hypothetical protein